jgi:hypothetical protein
MSEVKLAGQVRVMPRHDVSRLTRARQWLARRLYGAANTLEELGWAVDSQEWSGASAGDASPETVERPRGGLSARTKGLIAGGIIGSAAILAAVGWRLMPHGQHRE